MTNKQKKNPDILGRIIYLRDSDIEWILSKQSLQWQLWSTDYWCPDGDGVELYIRNDKSCFELSCFSGIGASNIVIYEMDFTYFQDKVENLDFKEPFEVQCCKIADYFCQLFSERGTIKN